ncbi:MAG: MarR family winged helix-turn-helix transcriptional regulator [Chloroflexota bacterium]
MTQLPADTVLNPPDPSSADAPWLTAGESRAWRAFLLATQLLMDQLDRELQHAADMPHTYYGILVVLSEQPDHAARMTEIADLLRFSRSRLTHAIARLEERGWVQRVVCPTDRRGTFAVITEAGLAALADAAPGHVAGVRRHVFDRLTPEQVEQLREISEAIAGPLLPAACAGSDARAAAISEDSTP